MQVLDFVQEKVHTMSPGELWRTSVKAGHSETGRAGGMSLGGLLWLTKESEKGA